MCFNIICLHRSILRKLHSLNRIYVRGRTIKTAHFFASFEEAPMVIYGIQNTNQNKWSKVLTIGGKKYILYPSANDNSQANLKQNLFSSFTSKSLIRRHALSCSLWVHFIPVLTNQSQMKSWVVGHPRLGFPLLEILKRI